jgi:hypothetical protein
VLQNRQVRTQPLQKQHQPRLVPNQKGAEQVNNPYAYPNTENDAYKATNGMTLLDHFAGQVLVGICVKSETNLSPEAMAGLCYKRAKAMLEQRCITLKELESAKCQG